MRLDEYALNLVRIVLRAIGLIERRATFVSRRHQRPQVLLLDATIGVAQ